MRNSSSLAKELAKVVTMDISKKWNMPVRDWAQCISQFARYFSDRLESELAI